MSRTTAETVADFMRKGPYAVVGASRDRLKYGNRVLRCYLARGLEVYPVNPHTDEVEGLQAWPDLVSVPAKVRGISVITPPEVTARVIEEAAVAGVEYAWLQPGAESDAVLERAAALGLQVIADGTCFLVVNAC